MTTVEETRAEYAPGRDALVRAPTGRGHGQPRRGTEFGVVCR